MSSRWDRSTRRNTWVSFFNPIYQLYSIVTSSAGHGTPDPEAFFHRQAREITIDADPPQRVIGDGEEWGQTPISVKVLPRAVRFLAAAATG